MIAAIDWASFLTDGELPALLSDPRVIAALIFVAAAGLIISIWAVARRIRGADAELEARLRSLEQLGVRPTDQLSILRDTDVARGALNRWLRDLSLANRLQRFIAQSGSEMGIGEFLGFATLIGLVVGATVYFSVWQDVRAFIFGIAAAGILPMWIAHRRAARMAKFSEQIPDAMDLMAGSLRAGHAYSAAVQVVADELTEPIATEFQTMAEEYRVGLSHRECLERLLTRVDHPDLHLFAVSVLIQTETGGNLAEILDGLAATVRSRFKLVGKVRAITAEGRLSGIILAILPVVVGAVLAVLNPKYFEPLIKERVGHIAIAVALFLQWIGYLWIRKITRVGE